MGSLSRGIKIPHNYTRELLLKGSDSIGNPSRDKQLTMTDWNSRVLAYWRIPHSPWYWENRTMLISDVVFRAHFPLSTLQCWELSISSGIAYHPAQNKWRQWGWRVPLLHCWTLWLSLETPSTEGWRSPCGRSAWPGGRPPSPSSTRCCLAVWRPRCSQSWAHSSTVAVQAKERNIK